MLIIRCPFKELFVQIEEKFCNGRLWPYPQPELFYFVARAALGRVLINRQPNADLDVPPNVRYWGKADMARTYQYVR